MYYYSALKHYDTVNHCTVNSFANGLSQNGQRLSLRGEIIPNNGLVTAEKIGESDSTALLCTTDNDNCCSSRVSEQQWLFPNGTRVPHGRESGWKLWTSYSDGVIRLHRHQTEADGSQVHGLFQCQIPNQSGISLKLYVGIYYANQSKLLNDHK